LVKAQNPDGGWGSIKGRHSNTEATSMALLALGALHEISLSATLEGGKNWFARRQKPDGSWPLNDASQEGSWTTALAVLALEYFPQQTDRVEKAARWVLGQRGSKLGLLAEAVLWWTGKSDVNEIDRSLVGWSWTPGAFSWVEPTSYALIALKKIRSRLAGSNINERIQQGEMMIYDRMCEGGGWNYGSNKILGVTLRPFPEVTAVALIALQDRAAEKANQLSLQALQTMMREVDSGLALGWGTICLAVYGIEVAEWQKQIVKRFGVTSFLGETKTMALSLLALGEGPEAFRL
jgi:hypothetical protein